MIEISDTKEQELVNRIHELTTELNNVCYTAKSIFALQVTFDRSRYTDGGEMLIPCVARVTTLQPSAQPPHATLHTTPSALRKGHRL
jgi:hypothetical protein